MMSEVTQDRRLQRGARSRQAILRHAVDVASLDGLDGLSFGGLASDLGLSKSGIQTLFGTKQKLQAAAVDAAADVFDDAVIRPTRTSPRGAARLRALVGRWIAYAEQPLFPGGCFWAANLPVFDSRPGLVGQRLAHQQQAWRGLIAAELRHAVDTKEIHTLDTDLTAFQIDAVLLATNTALRLGEHDAVDRLHRIIESVLTPSSDQ